jgi:uncharacterized protein YaiE (UPF0345 family)
LQNLLKIIPVIIETEQEFGTSEREIMRMVDLLAYVDSVLESKTLPAAA